ncbi:MAG: acyl-CoA dehydrogenase family protein [Dehalococcoidia bacterium]|nr:acyl-CoA dehydrogenase family protein [Dehalococcoidia bacterium]
MDFSLSEEQKMLQTMARDFLEKECPRSLVREMETDPTGHSTELWRKMAGLGWQGLIIPESYGGQGFSFLDLAVLLEETGRACLPGPLFPTVVLGAMTLMDAASEDQKRMLLPSVASGETILTLALTEPSATWKAEGVTTRAIREGDSYVINGTKLFILDAHVADRIICVARTGEGAKPEEGITLFLVDSKNPGLSHTLLKTIAADKQFEVVFKDVKVPSENVLGRVGEGWPIILRTLEHAAVAKCAEMVGGAQQVLEMTVEYAKERVQFGRPIGSFQAIQHHCANMATDVDGSRFITYQAAWMLSDGLPCTKEVAMAKAWVSDAYRRVATLGHQVHGGIGFTMDHDMQLYFRRAKSAASAFGNSDFHLNRVAAAGEP